MRSPVLRLIAYLFLVSMCVACIGWSPCPPWTTFFVVESVCMCVTSVWVNIVYYHNQLGTWNERYAYSGRQRANSCSNMCTITMVHSIYLDILNVSVFSWQSFLLFNFRQFYSVFFFRFVSPSTPLSTVQSSIESFDIFFRLKLTSQLFIHIGKYSLSQVNTNWNNF